jgi:periplasmic protein CpxP/Spy
MKVRSVLILAAALTLPVGGAFVAKMGLLTGTAAYADSSSRSLLAQATPSQAPEGEMGRGRMGEKWGQELNLTADQQAQIKSIRDQERTASESLRQQMKTARERLETLMAGNADEAQIRQQHQQVQQIGQQLGDRRFEMMLKVRNVLTSEQRTKAAQLMKQHEGRHRWGGNKNQSGAKGSM